MAKFENLSLQEIDALLNLCEKRMTFWSKQAVIEGKQKKEYTDCVNLYEEINAEIDRRFREFSGSDD